MHSPSLGRKHAIERERTYRHRPVWELKDWESVISAAGGRPRTPKTPDVLPCEMVLTGGNNRPNTLVVRCLCMAGTVGRPRPRFYGYDPVGEAATIEEALKIWREAGHGQV